MARSARNSRNARSFRPRFETLEDRRLMTWLTTPLGGQHNVDWVISNYMDLDTGSGKKDWKGNVGADAYTYDGHDAIDAGPSSFIEQDIGVPVLAAAAGTVIDRDDGNFDRQTLSVPCPPVDPNYVTVQHANGKITEYLHLRKDSVTVDIGDTVEQGQVLGLVGSSGCSSGPHLHFSLWESGVAVETYNNPSAYWANPLPYAGDTPGVLTYATTAFDPGGSYDNGLIDRDVFPLAAQTVFFSANVHGIDREDTMTFKWFNPAGNELTNARTNLTNQEIHFAWLTRAIVVPAIAGDWDVVLEINGQEAARDHFTFTTLLAEQRGKFQFNAPSYHVTENGLSALITVVRGGVLGNASVDVTLSPGSAQVGSDYQNVSQRLDFFDNEAVKTFSIPIVENLLTEMSESLQLTLSSPTNGAGLGTRSTAVLNIHDNDDGRRRVYLVPGTRELRVLGGDDSTSSRDWITVRRSGDQIYAGIYDGIDTVEGWFNQTDVSSILIHGRKGDDTINFESGFGIPVTIEGGPQTDQIALGTGNLDELAGRVTVRSDGSDSLVLNDQYVDFSDAYILTATELDRQWWGGLTYHKLNRLTLNAQAGDNTFAIDGVASAVTAIDGGSGDDLFLVGRGDYDNYILGELSLDGDAGDDTIAIDDSLDVGDDRYSVSDRTFDKDFALGTDFANVEVFNLRANDYQNVINVASVVSVATSILAGDGDDEVHVTWGRFQPGPFGYDLYHHQIQGLSVNGEEGSDTITMHDEPNPDSATYTLDLGRIEGRTQWDFFPSVVNYEGLEGVVVNGGGGSGTFNVERTLAGVPVTLNAGGGNDTIQILPTAKNLDVLDGTVFARGEAGTDRLVIHDESNIYSDPFTLTSSTVSRIYSQPIDYLGIESLDLMAGSGHNEITIQSSLATTTIAVDGGNGNDTLIGDAGANVLKGGEGDDLLIGNAGNDTLVGGVGVDTWRYVGTSAADTIVVAKLNATQLKLTRDSETDLFTFDAADRIHLLGGSGNDKLTINANVTNRATLEGEAGKDTLTGGSGNDTLLGGTENDTLKGKLGDDLIDGGLGTDTWFFEGTSDNEFLLVDWDAAALKLVATRLLFPFLPTVETDRAAGVEKFSLLAEGGHDRIDLSSLTTAKVSQSGLTGTTLNGGAGDDFFLGSSANDTIIGGAGADNWNYLGTAAADDLAMTLVSATKLKAARKNRGASAVLESDTFAFNSGDHVHLFALDNDDLISIAAAISINGSVDGGPGTDTCGPLPSGWTKSNCEA